MSEKIVKRMIRNALLNLADNIYLEYASGQMSDRYFKAVSAKIKEDLRRFS